MVNKVHFNNNVAVELCVFWIATHAISVFDNFPTKAPRNDIKAVDLPINATPRKCVFCLKFNGASVCVQRVRIADDKIV